MKAYIRTATRTKSTMRRRSKLTRALVSGGVILTLVSSVSWPGHAPDYAPFAYRMLPLTVESPEPQSSEPKDLIVELSKSEVEPTAKYSSYEVTLLCQTVWGEARGCSREEQMLVVWCICNRADSSGKSIEQVVLQPNQFYGYNPEHPVTNEIREVVYEVLDAWSRNETALVYEPYATSPNYLYFSGDGVHNWFREEY